MTAQNPKPPVWRRNEVDSPCVQVCVIHPETRLCLGCSRSIDEIAGWSRYTPEQRSAIMEVLPDRSPQPKKRRGGRMGRAR